MVYFPQSITVDNSPAAGDSPESVAVVFERSLEYAEFIGRQLVGRYNTYATAEADEARALIEEYRPMYLLLTADLPGADAVELVRWCRGLLPALATINVTTRQAVLDQMALKDAGVTHILPYPWGARELYLQTVTEERVRNGPPAWWHRRPPRRRRSLAARG
ncbi:MAG: response regulator [Burkholderiales bacterium]|nr:response regulator [Burkholderiales bacterium]